MKDQSGLRVVLTRLRKNLGKQTLGEWNVYDGHKKLFSCVTLELPYRDNKKFVSCIPTGTFLVKKRRDKRSKFKYEHLHLTNVTNRKWILVHIGNYTSQLQGCIAPGRRFFDLNRDGLIDVTSSEKTLKKLLSVLPEKFILEII